MSSQLTAPSIFGKIIKYGNLFFQKNEKIENETVKKLNTPKSNFFDLAFHVLFMLYALNYLLFVQTGNWLFSFGQEMTPEIYLEGSLTGIVLVLAGAFYAFKTLFMEFSFRMGLEWMLFGALLVKAASGTEDSALFLLIVWFYSIIRIIQMTGTNKIS